MRVGEEEEEVCVSDNEESPWDLDSCRKSKHIWHLL